MTCNACFKKYSMRTETRHMNIHILLINAKQKFVIFFPIGLDKPKILGEGNRYIL